MSSVLDIIVIAVLAIFAIIGFVKGFLNTILSLFGNLASLAIAIVIVKPCQAFFDKLFHIVNWLGGLIANGISGLLPTIEGTSQTGQWVIEFLNGKGDLISRLISHFVDSEAVFENQQALLDTVSQSMGQFASMVFTVIVMFVLIRIGIFFLSKLFDAITKKRALSGLDRLLGTAFGLVKGAVLLTAVLSVFYALAPIIPAINDWIAGSNITAWIYNYTTQLVNWLIKTIDWKAFAIIK